MTQENVSSSCQDDGHTGSVCTQDLVFLIQETTIVLSGEVFIINGNEVTIAQLSAASKLLESGIGITLIRVGEESIIRTTFGLTIRWSSSSYKTVISIDEQFFDAVAGLCGVPNNDPLDDYTNRDGQVSDDVFEFAESWGSQDTCPPPEECMNLAPPHVVATAREKCSILSSSSFAPCHEHVNVTEYIQLCESRICKSLWNNTDTEVDTCLCKALTMYATDCANSEAHIILDWRTPELCPVVCHHPMQWYECMSTCEWTCSSIGKPYQLCDTGCTPGCGCPPGLVRKGDTCVRFDECKECYCMGYGGIHYYSFDGTYFPFEGNCTYVLSRNKEPDSEFEILLGNAQCSRRPQNMCFMNVTVIYKNHEVILSQGPQVILDGQEIEIPSYMEVDGIQVSRPGGAWILYLNIPEIKVEVSFYDYNDGFSIMLPGTKYNDTEGLCGPCNQFPEDDFTMPDGTLTEDEYEFAASWLYNVGNDTTCDVSSVPPRYPITPEVDDECKKAIYEGVFSACNVLVDPAKYYRACLMDRTCKTGQCDTLFAYASECSKEGMCLDWRDEHNCPVTCPGDQIYYACHLPCRMTCANMNVFNEETNCVGQRLEGCFCPNGTIEDEFGNCVPTCERCIEEDGTRRVINETWSPSDCETCKCTDGGLIQCIRMECPAPPICADYKNLNFTRHAGVCCSTYECVCEQSLCPAESHAVSPICKTDQEIKTVTINECCSKEECACKPCPTPIIPQCEPYEMVEQYKENADDCCESFRCVCNRANCPADELECLPYHRKQQTPESLGACCAEYECVCSCPTPKMLNCSLGYENQLAEVDVRCDCDDYKCLAKEVCLWNNTVEVLEVQPGTRDLVGIDPCRTCDCLESMEPGSDFYKLDCEIIQCSIMSDLDCNMDSEYIAPEEGVCCGTCKVRWCVDDTGRHEINDTWTDLEPNNPCDYKQCLEDDDGTPKLDSYYVSCPPITPEDCPAPYYKQLEGECCPYCALQKTNCRNYTQDVNITVDGCTSNSPTPVGYCEGRCNSRVEYSFTLHQIILDCKCCQVVRSNKRVVDLLCQNGTQVEYEYEHIEGCDCVPCDPLEGVVLG
ncbi:intestinal mucin-like protein [Saccoglossus kowalevskii]